ncbi:MAG TPA: diacylglycerol kinase family protein [Burkholderiales bacterium]
MGDIGRAKGVPWRPLPALRYALRGVGFMLAERNTRLLLAVSAAVVAAGAWLGLSRLEWCAAIAALALVWVAETLNTAVERLTDLVSPEFHPLAGKTKDVAAGAVLIAMLAAVSIGVVVFGPRLF